jgi:hypothetical protein
VPGIPDRPDDNQFDQPEVVLGVDTHKDFHVAAGPGMPPTTQTEVTGTRQTAASLLLPFDVLSRWSRCVVE